MSQFKPFSDLFKIDGEIQDKFFIVLLTLSLLTEVDKLEFVNNYFLFYSLARFLNYIKKLYTSISYLLFLWGEF